MIRPGSALKKGKPKVANLAPKVAPGKKAESQKPDLHEFLDKCDYPGAIVLLEFEKKSKEERPHLLLWLAYSYFHNGDYRKALDSYTEALKKENDQNIHAYMACCLYALCQYKEAEDEVNLAPDSPL